MPYIPNHNERRRIDNMILFNLDHLDSDGHLNYFLASLFMKLMVLKGMSYNHAKEFIGELEAAKMEIYRRWIAPYEDLKQKENGDVGEDKDN